MGLAQIRHDSHCNHAFLCVQPMRRRKTVENRENPHRTTRFRPTGQAPVKQVPLSAQRDARRESRALVPGPVRQSGPILFGEGGPVFIPLGGWCFVNVQFAGWVAGVDHPAHRAGARREAPACPRRECHLCPTHRASARREAPAFTRRECHLCPTHWAGERREAPACPRRECHLCPTHRASARRRDRAMPRGIFRPVAESRQSVAVSRIRWSWCRAVRVLARIRCTVPPGWRAFLRRGSSFQSAPCRSP